MQDYNLSMTEPQPTWTITEPVKPRIFLPEVVRRVLGADSVHHNNINGLWHLCVWFGKPNTTVDPHPDSIAYVADSDQGFTTEEAIESIRAQRRELPDFPEGAAETGE